MEHFLVSVGIPASVVAALKLATMARLVLAAVLGAAVGLERELAGKPAGLRTTLLICVGAALFTELSLDLALLATGGGDALRADPARLAAQIIPGIGFIGAGAILHGRGRVTGLTTAATLWVITAIGIAVGAGAYVEALGATILVLFTLLLLRKAERFLENRISHRRYTASVDAADAFDTLVEAMQERKVTLKVESMRKRGNEMDVTFRLAGTKGAHETLVTHLLRHQGVRRFKRE